MEFALPCAYNVTNRKLTSFRFTTPISNVNAKKKSFENHSGVTINKINAGDL